MVEAGRDSDSGSDRQYPAEPDPLPRYDPKFRLADAGLVIDTQLLEATRIGRRLIGRSIYPGNRNNSGVLWWNLMNGHVKTVGPVQRACDLLGLDIDDVLRPAAVDALRVLP